MTVTRPRLRVLAFVTAVFKRKVAGLNPPNPQHGIGVATLVTVRQRTRLAIIILLKSLLHVPTGLPLALIGK